jgi:hypothetical protein
VMLQTSQDALKDDPVMKMLRAFCEMASIKVRSLVKVVTIHNFSDTVVSTAKEVSAKYILVPWSGSGTVVVEEPPFPPTLQVFTELKRKQSIHTPVQHASFVQDLFSNATCNVLILIDRGLEITNINTASTTEPHFQGPSSILNFQQIYLPFFGGRDDREALEMVAGLARGEEVRVTVVR